MVTQKAFVRRRSFRIGRLIDLFFASPQTPISLLGVVSWWEARRIPFNLLIGAYGFVCLCIFMWAITTSGQLELGEDAVEPIALLAAPIVINVLYTLGWLVEVPARLVVRNLSPRFGPILLKLGMLLGATLITLPAALWSTFRLLQVVGIVR